MRRRQRHRIYASDSNHTPQTLAPLPPLLPPFLRWLLDRLIRW